MTEASPSLGKEWVGAIDSWRAVDARLITSDHFGHLRVRGQVMVGPNEIGGEALFPPGVPSLTPESEDSHNDRKSWRFGTWKKLRPHQIYNYQGEGYSVDGTRDKNIVWISGNEKPETLARISDPRELGAIALTPDRNPAIESFIKDRIAEIGALAWRAITLKPGKQNEINLRNSLEELRMDAAQAFGDQWVKENLIFRPTDAYSSQQLNAV